jgi:hypothetical protein
MTQKIKLPENVDPDTVICTWDEDKDEVVIEGKYVERIHRNFAVQKNDP